MRAQRVKDKHLPWRIALVYLDRKSEFDARAKNVRRPHVIVLQRVAIVPVLRFPVCGAQRRRHDHSAKREDQSFQNVRDRRNSKHAIKNSFQNCFNRRRVLRSRRQCQPSSQVLFRAVKSKVARQLPNADKCHVDWVQPHKACKNAEHCLLRTAQPHSIEHRLKQIRLKEGQRPRDEDRGGHANDALGVGRKGLEKAIGLLKRTLKEQVEEQRGLASVSGAPQDERIQCECLHRLPSVHAAALAAQLCLDQSIDARAQLVEWQVVLFGSVFGRLLGGQIVGGLGKRKCWQVSPKRFWSNQWQHEFEHTPIESSASFAWVGCVRSNTTELAWVEEGFGLLCVDGAQQHCQLLGNDAHL